MKSSVALNMKSSVALNMKSSVAFAFVASACAHGFMKDPIGPSSISGLQSYGVFSAAWYTQGTQIGCEEATGVATCSADAPCCPDLMNATLLHTEQLSYPAFSLAQEYANIPTHLRGSPRTLANPFRHNPWMAPGHAPVANPCGILGGWRFSNASSYIAGMGDPTKKQLDKAGRETKINLIPKTMPVPVGTTGTSALLYDINMRMQKAQGNLYTTNDNTKWKAGTAQNVSYSLIANHGGGWQVRLCKLGHLLDETLTEECFEKMPLDFVGNSSWFEYNSSDNSKGTSRIPFTPVRVSDINTAGVSPKGSTWTKVGLPSCDGLCGGGDMCPYHAPNNCDKPQFDNAIAKAGFWGYGNSNAGNSRNLSQVLNNWQIVDTVWVPDGLEGDYVVSWRWDSEQSSQVWTQCAVVTIEA